ncbi:MAG: hypothetical protein C4B55_01480 [Candidatus Methanophagaceae archaeon]|nr:MAG: hypothetical protein C4B55_01480 [Methanophagales archaeon]
MPSNSNQTFARVVVVAAVCVFSTQFGVTVVAPLLGGWVAASETPFLVAALIFSAFTLVSAPLGVPGGVLSDRLGRKPLVVAGLLLYAAASVLFPFSDDPYDWIFVRALQGAGAGLFFPAVSALLAEVTSQDHEERGEERGGEQGEERGRAFSVYNIGLGVGLAAGPISGGLLFEAFGIFVPFLFCVGFAVLSAVLVAVLVQEPRERSERRRGGGLALGLALGERERRALGTACVVIFFGIGVAAIMESLFSPFATNELRLSTGVVGAVLSAMLGVFATLQLGFSRLMQKVGEVGISAFGLFLCAVGLLMLYFVTSVPSVLGLLLVSAVLGAGLGAVSLGTLTLASDAVGAGGGVRGVGEERGKGEERGVGEEKGEREERGKREERGEREERGAGEERGEREERGVGGGKVMGIYYTAFYAGLGGVPLVCGVFSDILGARRLFLGYAVLLFVLAFAVWQGRVLRRGKTPAPFNTEVANKTQEEKLCL